jgi:hypothetical protein
MHLNEKQNHCKKVFAKYIKKMAPTRQTKIAYNKEKNENRLKKYSSTSVI